MSKCKLNIILDIDHTLVHTLVDLEDLDLTNFSTPGLKSVVYTLGSKIYRSIYRPGLEDFLEYLFTNYNVAIYTAGTAGYAKAIIENIILKDHPDRNLCFVYARDVDAKSVVKYPNTHKKLKYIFETLKPEGFFACNTVIIDDNSLVKYSNKWNTIRVPAFKVFSGKKVTHYTYKNIKFLEESLKDNVLKEVLQNLEAWRLKYLENCSEDNNFTGCPYHLNYPIFKKNTSHN
jgi:TFIIF-interacting CTD phosphatase-like protein